MLGLVTRFPWRPALAEVAAKVSRPGAPGVSGSRGATCSASGGILAEPVRVRGGVAGLVMAVVPGLLLGAAISKNIANFLEENDLFVPADDDDDDD